MRQPLQYSPYRPFTESSSLLASYPTPSLNTISTFSISAMRVAGSPFITTRSAFFPVEIEPI